MGTKKEGGRAEMSCRLLNMECGRDTVSFQWYPGVVITFRFGLVQV